MNERHIGKWEINDYIKDWGQGEACEKQVT